MRLGAATLIGIVLILEPGSAFGQAKAAGKVEMAFGLRKGMTVKEVRAVAPLRSAPESANIYITNTPPRPVTLFRRYFMMISPTVGLCRVMATTDSMPESEGSASIAFQISDILVEKYGAPDEPWTKDPQTLLVWSDPLGRGSQIRFAVSRDAKGEVAFLVNYLFTNFATCRKEDKEGM